MENMNEKIDGKDNGDPKENINIILYLAGKIVSLLGTHIYTFAISLYILRTTGSGLSFALSVLLGMVPRVLLSPVAGSLADKRDRKKMVVGLDILSGIIVLGLVVISSIYGLRLIFIYATTLFLAVVNTFFDVSIGAAIPNLVSDKNLVKINSYTQASTSLAAIMGPVLGGLIYGLVPIKLFLIINGISFLISGFSESFINFKYNMRDSKEKEELAAELATESPIQVDEKGIKALLKDIKEGLDFIKELKPIYALMKFALLYNLLINATLAVIMPFIINDTLKMSSTQFGVIEGSFSVGVLITSIVIGKLPEREKNLKILVIGTVIMGLMVAFIGIPAIGSLQNLNTSIHFIYFILVMIIFSACMIFVNIPISVAMQRMTPDKMMGRVMGTMGTLAGGIAPLGIIVSGLLLDVLPPFIIPIISGILIIIAALVMSRDKNLRDF
ncbi:MFS transporter [Clostridium sp. D2Q-11]|uniref:MFS transporter n=1 Tax=Anaeromonas frigoriresistens TaxID=2683708 RepID=A0A942UU34_9FIRM|nr:MFS transporter [Anaeromonas frigoriresistens]MBS4539163.1 MFS transporter [Anaeromonas frigoriresistens]